tara:strand:+ start:24132 stop:24569 length:438 start_codon:yes stop_codon:yes gene_type:complete
MSTNETPPLNDPGLWWPSPPEIMMYLCLTAFLGKKLNLQFYMSWFLDIVLHTSLPFILIGIMVMLTMLAGSLWYAVRVGFIFNLLEGPIWCLANLVCFMTVDPAVFQGAMDLIHELVSDLPEKHEEYVHYYRQACRRIQRGEYPQ